MELKNAIARFNTLGTQRQPFLFMISYDMSQTLVFTPEQARLEGIRFEFPGYSNLLPDDAPPPPHDPLVFNKEPVAFQRYLTAFNHVMEQLYQGNSYLVNLTFPSRIETNWSLNEIFFNARAKYKLLYGSHFLFFSPETFVTIRQGIISTFPMKGTIDASRPNARQDLLSNVKEQAEHATIVDLLRNDLSQWASQVRVERFRYVDEVVSNEKNLLQVSSEITGQLPADHFDHLGTIFFSLLPAGSVTGAPKPKTLGIINRAEQYPRGFYTGVAGYFDGEQLESCVMIRFIENSNNTLWYKSGGGITSMSRPDEEYRELIDKIYVPLNRIDKS